MAKNLTVSAFKGLAGKATRQILSKVNPLDALSTIIGHVREWETIKETEQTKRHEISAKCNVLVEHIHAERDKFIYALEMNYRERSVVYSELFKRLDDALEVGNVEIASLAMQGIVEQIKNNPLPSFSDFKQSFLTNQPLDF